MIIVREKKREEIIDPRHFYFAQLWTCKLQCFIIIFSLLTSIYLLCYIKKILTLHNLLHSSIQICFFFVCAHGFYTCHHFFLLPIVAKIRSR
jgi:hypothetical protein